MMLRMMCPFILAAGRDWGGYIGIEAFISGLHQMIRIRYHEKELPVTRRISQGDWQGLLGDFTCEPSVESTITVQALS